MSAELATRGRFSKAKSLVLWISFTANTWYNAGDFAQLHQQQLMENPCFLYFHNVFSRHNRKSVCLRVVFALFFLGKPWQKRWPSCCTSLWCNGLCVGLPVCQYVYVSPAEFTCCHCLCVCVCVCVHVVASSTFCSVFVLVQFDRRPPEPAVPWFLWSWCEHVTDRFVCVNVLVFPVAVLLVLTWPWCVCVRNWKKRIHRCYCNRGESDGDAVSLCINTFVKPLLKTDDCSRRAQWSSTKELECSSWSGAIVMMETQLKKMYFYTSSVSTMLQLFLSRSCCSFCGDQSPGILLHANRPVIHTSILLISNNILFRLTLVFAVCAFCYNVLAVCWFNWPTASRTK